MIRPVDKPSLRQISQTAACFVLVALLSSDLLRTQNTTFPQAGADSRTPSRSHYFDWINSQYEGTTEGQTLLNLEFFGWLHDRFGMRLDIYSLDVGNIDDGPYTAGVGRLIPFHYGSLESKEFREQFPNGFGPVVERAASFGCRLGLWMGPDGFGTTPEDERDRKDLLVTLCRDYNFHLFKLDGVAGPFRREKTGVLIETLKKCREYTPDLIVSSHRVDFGEAEPYITHHLWEGEETYVDVFINNRSTAPHHRAGSLERKLTLDLDRMYEDHGVCFSSCLDYWDDELILQAFNRSLILAPQIYGNPWFLRDDEYPRFARIFNLHRKYRDILVEGIRLPDSRYGPYAMSRGNGRIRLISLRNLSWEPRTYTVGLDASLGLAPAEDLEVKQYHPTERVLGILPWGGSIPIRVDPFRTCLLKISSDPGDELNIYGCDYEVIRDVPGEPVRIRLLGEPGLKTRMSLAPGPHSFQKGFVAGKEYSLPQLEEGLDITFPGVKLRNNYHRKLGEPVLLSAVPPDAEALFESTCFAADNNALEVRCIQRSGPTEISQVQACREAFFNKPMFINRGIWDRNLFDGDLSTFFIARLEDKTFRLDMGEHLSLDSIVIRIRDRQEYDLNPAMNSFSEEASAEVSSDLVHWDPVQLDSTGKGTIARIRLDPARPVRFLRITGPPRRIAEIEAYSDGKEVDRALWRASNLFGGYGSNPAVKAWGFSFTPNEIPADTYLAAALNGTHGNEGAYAALRIGDEYVGASDRAVSFPSNTWEYFNVESDRDYTYYFPMTPDYVGREVEVVILGLKDGVAEFRPEVWITAYPAPFQGMLLELK
jgi:hypothetical protein